MKLSNKPCKVCSPREVPHKMLGHNERGCQVLGCDCLRKPE